MTWALGLTVGKAEIGIDGDHAKGEADIECDKPLLRRDKIAISAAGVEAQSIFMHQQIASLVQ